jgi:(p)ppGpp synthase/HD superfamily hydrolase
MAHRPDSPTHRQLAYATYLAALAHDGQFRKGEAVPYLVHPLRVGEILAHVGCDYKLVIAGILHDVLEDGCRDEYGRLIVGELEIRKEFGQDVLDLVQGASEPDKEATWEARKQHTIDFLRDEASLEVCVVACADKLDNVSSSVEDKERLGDDFWKRFKRGAAEQRWYHSSLVEVFTARTAASGDERLRVLVARYAVAVNDLYGEDS